MIYFVFYLDFFLFFSFLPLLNLSSEVLRTQAGIKVYITKPLLKKLQLYSERMLAIGNPWVLEPESFESVCHFLGVPGNVPKTRNVEVM